jgi:hypothetical protein
MKEPYMKGIANYLDPESCVGDGNVADEALAFLLSIYLISLVTINLGNIEGSFQQLGEFVFNHAF